MISVKKAPLLLNLQPSGGYFREDFYYAGRIAGGIKELSAMLHQSVITANGRTMAENRANAECFDPEVIGTMAEPVKDLTGLAVVRGNLCENGAVIKPSASLKLELMQHRGRAVGFEDIDDYKARLDDPNPDVMKTAY